MKTKITLIFASLFLFIFSYVAYGQPSNTPHQFGGDVLTNGNPAPDNLLVVAKIDGQEAADTLTKNGTYGHAPDMFFVTDPNGNYGGKTIEFFVGDVKATEYVFSNGKITTLDLSVTGDFEICGDGAIDEGEECDTTDFGGNSCSTYGYNSGSLSCTNECTINSSGCYNTESPPSPPGGGGGGGGGGGSSGGGGGGGGGGAFFTCNQDWECGEWSACDGRWQTRECDFVKVAQHTQSQQCPSEDEVPTMAKKCEIVEEIETTSAAKGLQGVETETEESDESENLITGMAVSEVEGEPNTLLGSMLLLMVVVLGILLYHRFFRKKDQ